MTVKLDEQAAAARQEAAARVAVAPQVRPPIPSGVVPRTARPVIDPRINQIQSRLEEQQKAIASNREDLTKARDDLQGKLDSTRSELSGSITSSHDELSGSIARTHDEIVALQKRGERNYYEFTLNKSKEFRRVGPLSLSVRKVDTKRKSYDLAMFVDDNQLQKKSVNLFEPVWINLQDQSQPVQLVVNQISKDQIQGYISAPKYKRSELGDTASTSPQPLSATQPALKQP
jgi:septal ring factor EnvC (AmiA/AmiB activator)